VSASGIDVTGRRNEVAVCTRRSRQTLDHL